MDCLVLGIAILRVSPLHRSRPHLVGHFRRIAEEVRVDTNERFGGKYVPPFLSLFIKGQNIIDGKSPAFSNPPLDPALSYPLLGAIAVREEALTPSIPEEIVRHLMYQKICLLAFAAGCIGWDYTDEKLLPLMEKRTNLLNAFMDKGLELDSISLIQMKEFVWKEFPSYASEYFLHTPRNPNDIKNAISSYLMEWSEKREEKDLLFGFALGHYWTTTWLRNKRNLSVDRLRAFCLRAASILSGVEMDAIPESLRFDERTRKIAKNLVSQVNENMIGELFSGQKKLHELDVPFLP